MLRIALILSLSLFLVSCGATSYQNPSLKYYESGKSKPVVAVMPVLNKAEVSDVSWDLSEELSEGFNQRITDQGKVYVTPKESLAGKMQQFQNKDLFLIQPSDLSGLQQANEFLVFLELIEHKSVPYRRQHIKPIYPIDGKADSVLMMKMRVKVYDLRGEEPKVILQEIVHSNHMMPEKSPHDEENFSDWKDEGYAVSSMGRAHSRLVRDIAVQIEKYIDLAKS